MRTTTTWSDPVGHRGRLALAALRRAACDAGRVVPHRLTSGPHLRSIERMAHIAAPRPEPVQA